MNNKTLYFQSDNKDDNYAYARCYVKPFKPIDKFKNIGDGTFDLLTRANVNYLGVKEFGTLCNITGEEYPLPVRPWYSGTQFYDGGGKGDILSYDNIKKKIGNTSKNKNNILKWHKFISDNKILYFCDRVILVNILHKTLYENNLLNKIIEIDNKKFFCRVPTEKEILNFIKNDIGIQNVPIPSELDIRGELNYNVKERFNSLSNKFWNFLGAATLCYDNEKFISMGYYGPNNNFVDNNTNWSGWRPVLEELPYKYIETAKLKDSIYKTSNSINFNKIKDIEYINDKKQIQILL